MKKFCLVIIVIALGVCSLFAQKDSSLAPKKDDSEIKTLFNSNGNPATVGYYVGPEFSYTRFDGEDVFMGGFGGGMIINHFFSIGLAGQAIMNPRNLWYDNIENRQGAYLYGGYGGVKLEFRAFPASPINVSFPVLLGGGGMMFNTWEHNDFNYDAFGDYKLSEDGFFVVEPGIMIGLNITKFMRIDAGGTYRYASGLHISGFDNSLINKFNGNISLKFGKF